jgi:ABC-type uncharacterized transport system substrate-binding protein
MRRREFISLIGSVAATWPLVARAQRSDEVRRIGVLMPTAATDPPTKLQIAALVHQLQELGWSEGRNLRIDYRWADGDAERMQVFAKELVALQPHLILGRSTPVTAALLRQKRTIPIVFTMVSDPVGERYVESLARPGGNVTGFTNVEFSLTGKWLELLKEVAPNIKRVAFIFDPKVAPAGRIRQCAGRRGAGARRTVRGKHPRHNVPERNFRLLGRRYIGDRLSDDSTDGKSRLSATVCDQCDHQRLGASDLGAAEP